MTIQWFPGHMAKAKREVSEQLRHVDFVMELVDARVPRSSQNPMLQDILQQKPKFVILMKKDLAYRKKTKKWIIHVKKKSISAIAVNINNKVDILRIVQTAKLFCWEKSAKFKAKGIQSRAIRAMIL